MTTTVRYEPRKEVIIHELVPFDSSQEMIEFLTFGLPGPFAPLHWVDGLLLVFNPLPHTQEVSKEIIQGKLHWDSCIVAPMEKYSKDVTLPLQIHRISIVNVSNNPTFKAIAKELKDTILPSLKKD